MSYRYKAENFRVSSYGIGLYDFAIVRSGRMRVRFCGTSKLTNSLNLIHCDLFGSPGDVTDKIFAVQNVFFCILHPVVN